MAVAHIALVAASGCYEPRLRDCTIRCSGPSDCASGQICLEDGYCAGHDVSGCTEEGDPIIVDAAIIPIDAPDGAEMADARDICSQGCTNGTCIDGVCTIDCSATGSCLNDVTCPANLPCHVVCGDMACQHKIFCSLASSCKVDCAGNDACHDEIQCGSGPCDVTCTGFDSCDRRTKCSLSCGCDVTCSGTSSCAEASECPSFSCRVGNGCSSQVAGCNTCQ